MDAKGGELTGGERRGCEGGEEGRERRRIGAHGSKDGEYDNRRLEDIANLSVRGVREGRVGGLCSHLLLVG